MRALFAALFSLALCAPSFARLWGDRLQTVNNQSTMLFWWVVGVSFICGFGAILAIYFLFRRNRALVTRAPEAEKVDETSVRGRFVKLVVKRLQVDRALVIDSANFREDLGAYSMDLVELLQDCEEEFQIEIPDQEVGGIATVGTAIEYLEKHLPADD